MRAVRNLLRGGLAVALVSLAVTPAGATTLIRQGLDRLVASNATIVVGEVLDTSSYWNDEGTFILTDVRIAPQEVLKGNLRDRELVVTIMGGTVLDLTTLIVGGAELAPGKAYVLFLNEGDLPGARGVRTVRDHCQGVFDLVSAQDGLRAISQASRHPLAPDAKGYVEAPGGTRGIPFDALRQSIHELVRNSRDARREVK
jgi:hypothetical protein